MLDPGRSPHPLRRRLPDDAQLSLWPAPDGWQIRRFSWQPRGATRGTILFAGGRGDIFEKYLETFDHWRRRGWAIAAFDWRGHGGSGRAAASGPHATVGHVDSFATLVEDLGALWAEIALGPSPHVAMGHSMGGHVLLRALAERTVAPDAAVLTSPMIRIRSPLGDRLSGALAQWHARRGDPARPAWRPRRSPGTQIDSDAMLTGDYGRLLDEHWWHEQMPGLRLGPPSWGWLAEAFASSRRLRANAAALAGVATPVLVLAADGDRLTDSAASARIARHLPHARFERFARGGHELLREIDPIRSRALSAIDAFIDGSDRSGRPLAGSHQ